MTETLDKRIRVLDKNVENEENKAKEFLKKKKQKDAMACLKKKKIYEEQRTKLEAQRMNMEQLLMTTQEAETIRDIVDTQRRVQQELAHSMPSVEVVEKTNEDLQEQLDNQREISDLIAQPIGNTDMDDDDLLAELEGLQDEVDDEFKESLMPDMPSTMHLPDPNQGNKVAQQEEEADDDVCILF